MKHSFQWLMALALSTSLATAEEGKTMTEDQTNVMQAITQMTQGYADQNLDTIMASYMPQATVLFEPNNPIADRAKIAAMFVDSFALNPAFSFGEHEIIVNGDTALHIMPWTMTGKVPDGPEIADDGLSIAVLRRQADNSWQMVIDNPHGQRLMPN